MHEVPGAALLRYKDESMIFDEHGTNTEITFDGVHAKKRVVPQSTLMSVWLMSV